MEAKKCVPTVAADHRSRRVKGNRTEGKNSIDQAIKMSLVIAGCIK